MDEPFGIERFCDVPFINRSSRTEIVVCNGSFYFKLRSAPGYIVFAALANPGAG